jgi:hypothetical protein
MVLPTLPKVGHVVEPTAGSGQMVRRLFQSGAAKVVTSVEIQSHFESRLKAISAGPVIISDYLDVKPRQLWGHGEPRYIVGNPPYTSPRPTIGAEIVAHSLSMVDGHDGICAFLLPLTFCCSKSRWEMIHRRWQSHCSLLPISRRIRFSGAESSGKTDVAWFVWRFGKWAGSGVRFKILGDS